MNPTYESIIKSYFDAWITKDVSILSTLFSPSVRYTESFGPHYEGIEELTSWFTDWHHHGQVECWDIQSFVTEQNTVAVEWYFKCIYDGKTDAFDGVSLITFDTNGQIDSVKEFQSDHKHTYPYHYPTTSPTKLIIRRFSPL